jgi:hypothetical protein
MFFKTIIKEVSTSGFLVKMVFLKIRANKIRKERTNLKIAKKIKNRKKKKINQSENVS